MTGSEVAVVEEAALRALRVLPAEQPVRVQREGEAGGLLGCPRDPVDQHEQRQRRHPRAADQAGLQQRPPGDPAPDPALAAPVRVPALPVAARAPAPRAAMPAPYRAPGPSGDGVVPSPFGRACGPGPPGRSSALIRPAADPTRPAAEAAQPAPRYSGVQTSADRALTSAGYAGALAPAVRGAAMVSAGYAGGLASSGCGGALASSGCGAGPGGDSGSGAGPGGDSGSGAATLPLPRSASAPALPPCSSGGMVTYLFSALADRNHRPVSAAASSPAASPFPFPRVVVPALGWFAVARPAAGAGPRARRRPFPAEP